MKKNIVFFIILATLLLASCQAPTPASTSTPVPTISPTVDLCTFDEIIEASENLANINQRWADEFQITAATFNDSPKEGVRNLQEIVNELDLLSVPICADKAKSLQLKSMECAIDGLLARLAKEPNSIALSKFECAEDYMNQYLEEITDVITCSPDCYQNYVNTTSEENNIQDSTNISNTQDFLLADKQPGIYLVNVDIAPGIWRNNGTSDECYWEITTETGEIIDNHMGMSGGTANIPATAFQVTFEKECGTWSFIK